MINLIIIIMKVFILYYIIANKETQEIFKVKFKLKLLKIRFF